jgi:hypothetical protein
MEGVVEGAMEGGNQVSPNARFVHVLSAVGANSSDMPLGKLCGETVLQGLAKAGITDTDVRLKASLKAMKEAGCIRTPTPVAEVAHHLKDASVLISKVICLSFPPLRETF